MFCTAQTNFREVFMLEVSLSVGALWDVNADLHIEVKGSESWDESSGVKQGQCNSATVH